MQGQLLREEYCISWLFLDRAQMIDRRVVRACFQLRRFAAVYPSLRARGTQHLLRIVPVNKK